MSLDLFPNEQADLLAQGARQPATSLQATPGEAFAAARESADRFNGILSEQHNTADATQDWLDGYAAKTGERLQNPYALGWNPMGWDISAGIEKLHDVRARTAAKAAETGDDSLNFPDDATLFASGVKKARTAMGALARTGEGVQPFGTGLARMAGGFVAQADDPMNLGLNAIAMGVAPGGGSLLRGLLGTAATFGAQTLGEEASTYRYKQAVNPEYGPSDVATAVVSSAVTGAGLDALGHAGAAIFRRMLAKAPEAVPTLPTPIRDAGYTAERAIDLDAQNPFKGVAGQAAHTEAIAKIEGDILNDRPPDLPAAAQAEAAKPTGDVFSRPEPSPLAVIDRHAAAANPGLYERVGRAEGDIAQARAALDDLQAPAGEPSTYGALSSRIGDLQGQLDAITGKRRSSPRAQALRDEIERLKSSSDSLDADAASRSADRAQLLRERLNDSQNARALLGPDVRAAREASAQTLGIPLDTDSRLDAMPSHSGNRFEQAEPRAAEAASVVPTKRTRSKSRKGEQPAPDDEAPAPPTAAEVDIARATAERQAATGEANTYVGRRAVRVKYELAEHADLITSHDANFTTDPRFPADLQPRNRGGVAPRDQVFDMAANLQPERLGPSPESNSGTPLVGPDNVVESGNGRAMAIGMAYRQGSERAAAYRAFLERSGYDTTGMNAPVLIGRRVTPMSDAERAAFAHSANGSASLRMSATEQALSDARHITPGMADALDGSNIATRANAGFVRDFVDRLTPGERGAMLTADGSLSAAGLNRVRAAMVARAYGDPEVVARAFDSADGNIKTLAAALTESSPDWIKMRDAVTAGDIPAGRDITDDVMTAVRAIMRARDEGRPVGEVMHQGDMFVSDTSSLAARLFFKDGSFTRFLSKADMGENLSSFARGVLETRGKGDDLFGQPPPGTQATLAATVRRSDQRVLSMIDAARRPDAITKAIGDTKVDEAAVANLQRSIAQQEPGKMLRVPIEDEHGNVSLGLAEKELHEIDAQTRLADEVRACSTPETEAAA